MANRQNNPDSSGRGPNDEPQREWIGLGGDLGPMQLVPPPRNPLETPTEGDEDDQPDSRKASSNEVGWRGYLARVRGWLSSRIKS